MGLLIGHLPRLLNAFLVSCFLAVIYSAETIAGADQDKWTNVLWIVFEDISPNPGCYGDGYAVTPNLDRFAG